MSLSQGFGTMPHFRKVQRQLYFEPQDSANRGALQTLDDSDTTSNRPDKGPTPSHKWSETGNSYIYIIIYIYIYLSSYIANIML